MMNKKKTEHSPGWNDFAESLQRDPRGRRNSESRPSREKEAGAAILYITYHKGAQRPPPFPPSLVLNLHLFGKVVALPPG